MRQIEQLLAREHTSGALAQDLRRCESARVSTMRVPSGSRNSRSQQSIRRSRNVSMPALRFDRLGGGEGASPEGADARQRFAWIERLRQVIVGAHLQPDDGSSSSPFPVNMITGTSERVRSRRHSVSPSSPGNIRSSTMRSMRLSSSTRLSVRPSADDRDVEVVSQIAPDEPADLDVVFHNENMDDAFNGICML